MKAFCSRAARWTFGIVLVILTAVLVWNYNRVLQSNFKTMPSLNEFLSGTWPAGNSSRQQTSFLVMESESPKKETFPVLVNLADLNNKVSKISGCLLVAREPHSFWRSQPSNGSQHTADEDIARMDLAYSCGMLYPEYLSTPPVPDLYPFEKFFLSEPPLTDLSTVADPTQSNVSLFNHSQNMQVGDIVALKIVVKDTRSQPKQQGGDQIRVWFEDSDNKAKMAAGVQDFNNGTYLASAPLLWAGKLRLRVVIAYPREYLRAVLHVHRSFKSFRQIAANFQNTAASEATPCYHTPVIPGFTPSELCNFTQQNGSPWYCGRPIKRQLNCTDLTGTLVIKETKNYPVTDQEMEVLLRSCREPRIREIPHQVEIIVSAAKQLVAAQKPPCHQIPVESTWKQGATTGHFEGDTWVPRLCRLPPSPDYQHCLSNKQILILGDSNGRSYYYIYRRYSGCADVKKALAEKWHKPLMCVHQAKNFTLRWEPHTNPFMNGREPATIGSLVASASAIDEIPSKGAHLIILNHYFHLTVYHFSAIDLMLRSIKDALVRLFRRNPNVHVVLQGPYISWFGWQEHYAAGDMLVPFIQELEREIFAEVRDKVIFLSTWDITVASVNWDFHPAVNPKLFDTIVGFTCGRR